MSEVSNLFDIVAPPVVRPPVQPRTAEQVADARAAILDRIKKLGLEKKRREYVTSLHAFVVDAWKIIEPDQVFVDNWHIREACKVLQEVTEGKHERVVVNVPPGTMKTLLISVLWPVWEWAHNPALRFLFASYGSHRTIDANVKSRDIIVSSWFKELYPTFELKDDQNAKQRLNTTAGGWRIATSIGGVGTGEHPDRVIIDDPLTADDARSDKERSKANTWFDRTVSSRGVSRGVRVVVVMQRLHENDLSGHLLNRGGWHHVCWPMRYELTQKDNPKFKPDPRDPRTVPGELLWPAVYDEKKVRQLEIDLDAYGTAGQLQQRPAPEGGGLFKREWFKIIDVAPAKARRIVRGWDTAATEEGQGNPDYTVGCRMSELDDIFYVEDIVRDQLSPFGVDTLMIDTARHDGKSVSQREEREPGGSGKTVTAARARTLKGYDYKEVAVSLDKITRSKPFRAQCEAGNVVLIRGDWNEEYIRELCAFPTGANDDQVDASSCAFNAVLLEPKPIKGATWGR